MSNKNSVEELLAELFTDEVSNSTTDALNNEDEFNKNHDRSIQYVLAEETFEDDVITFLASNDADNYKEIEDDDFEKLFRMNKTTFYELQHEISNASELEFRKTYDTNLLMCLWILGNTAPIHEATLILGLTEKHVEAICEKYFRKIIDLSSKYITWPTPCEMMTLENIFKTEYEFPTVVGAIGCLHIAVQMSENISNCSDYFNMNSGNYTIVLQAVCDSNLIFRDIFVGFPGSNTVEDILRSSPLNEKLTEEESFLRKTNKHLLGGTEHPQLDTLLTPYPFSKNKKLNETELKFNSMHSSAMLVVDKTFHIIENRFQRMKCLDCVNVEFATLAVGAICILHNFTKLRNDNSCISY